LDEFIVVGVCCSNVGDQVFHEVGTVLRYLFRVQIHGERCQCLACNQGVGGRFAVEHQTELADLDDALAGVRAFHVNAQWGFLNHPDVPGQGGAGVEFYGVAINRFAVVGGGQHQATDCHGFVGACIVGLLDLFVGSIDDGAGAHTGVQAVAEVAHCQLVVVDLTNAGQNVVVGAQGGCVVRVVNLGHGPREGGGHHGGQ